MSKTAQRIFLITGASSGFGRALAKAALAAGNIVIGTVRNHPAKVEFEGLHANHAHGVLLDVSDFDSIDAAINEVAQRVGLIDVLVNSAGYGHEGILEESPLEELRRQFDVNVFGAVAMIKAVLPSMRIRRTGHIINITSMAGLVTFPGISYYCGSKFALEGISEALEQEVRSFGIKVTAVAPGAFRTDWAGRSMVRTEHSIDDYDTVFAPIRRARLAKDGKQPGDPAKAAKVLLDLIDEDVPPVHLVLGDDALRVVRDKISALSREIDARESVSKSTGFS
ncbi:3-phenylpropionate-dihydrodiol/cinnamic acid-dihydrodiol dehydrogenase [Paraburkholderia aspalathi]|uniref:3-phenylpropionate-dihydrodiol/cinnamic acid-dihydrodiol dehydrogenase n=1 Tax=Paraburkholderia aspalathi TaxID=1324617 RepID=A0ABN7MVU6_9BURK|nr:oxidoreductase [Paraburkholderia aspalathi]MBK3822005.1 oxidoreductase [Paraburkholderia aspalathi]MBK3833839.1 oxidoreductase [Paraburkholderia aspalathi]MBK3863544.1 oxidoreductase [Paraburkholderia aspalathi]CAE6817287.1 3-phenylpropionate-dihydrodiol/cinnamic acid-dihydrodiol dehydrogenase [Paraburkholderia aspalathi]